MHPAKNDWNTTTCACEKHWKIDVRLRPMDLNLCACGAENTWQNSTQRWTYKHTWVSVCQHDGCSERDVFCGVTHCVSFCTLLLCQMDFLGCTPKVFQITPPTCSIYMHQGRLGNDDERTLSLCNALQQRIGSNRLGRLQWSFRVVWWDMLNTSIYPRL
uniref:Uncharacterized protein n=1 Tax=Lutzomyia longipalpis TaxID=7200 RepID=A0A1B0CC87_LUTLO